MDITVVQKIITNTVVDRRVIATVSNLRGPQGAPGNTNLFIQDTQPAVNTPYLWVQTLPNNKATLYLEDGE